MELTQEKVRELFEYRDGKLYWRIKPNRRTHAGSEAGTLHPSGYWRIGLYGKNYRVHRLIFLYHHGYLPEEVDHVNMDKLDNRIENLRAATRSSNCHNMGLRRDNTSGVKGVSWRTCGRRWFVQVRLNGKHCYVDYFPEDEFEFACLVAQKARERFHGEFARHE